MLFAISFMVFTVRQFVGGGATSVQDRILAGTKSIIKSYAVSRRNIILLNQSLEIEKENVEIQNVRNIRYI